MPKVRGKRKHSPNQLTKLKLTKSHEKSILPTLSLDTTRVKQAAWHTKPAFTGQIKSRKKVCLISTQTFYQNQQIVPSVPEEVA